MTDKTEGIDAIAWITRLVTLISLAIATYAAIQTLPFDAEIKRLRADSERLDNAIKQADADLKNLESNRKITIELYQEVRNIIEKKENDPREEEAVRVLVESLADDPFRWKLLNVIAAGAKSQEVKSTAAEAAVFYKEESQVDLNPSASQSISKPKSGVGYFNIDFFYCEQKKSTNEPLARAALSLKTASDTGRWRLRSLPESVNQQPGYRITKNVIRFTPPEEKEAAEAIASKLKTQGVNVQFQEISYPTPGYISVFICQ